MASSSGSASETDDHAPVVSIVSPCFNEEESLSELLRRVLAVGRSLNSAFEFILVDDGSSDGTWRLIEEAAAEHPEVHGVKLSRNYGHQIALTSGLFAARGDRILMLDADLQDPPELLPAMIDLMERGYDIIYGKRAARKGETAFKRASAKVFYRIIDHLSDVSIPVDTGDFRLVNRRALDEFLNMKEKSRYVRGMFAWIGLRQIGLEYEREARFAGETKYPLKAMLRFAADALTGFSIAPLRLATSLAYMSLAVAAAMAIYVISSLVFAQTVSGWASILLAISFFSGIQLLTLGILGEYVGRLYSEAKGRPLYIVEDETRSNARPSSPVVGQVQLGAAGRDSGITS